MVTHDEKWFQAVCAAMSGMIASMEYEWDKIPERAIEMANELMRKVDERTR